MKMFALGLAALALASPAAFLQSRQGADGGFAEAGGTATPGLTAWAAIGLAAVGAPTGKAHAFLVAHEPELESATDVELAAAAEAVTGGASPPLLTRLRALVEPSGRIGPALNSTIWGILALRQAGEPVAAATVAYLVHAQSKSGGFGWDVLFVPEGATRTWAEMTAEEKNLDSHRSRAFAALREAMRR